MSAAGAGEDGSVCAADVGGNHRLPSLAQKGEVGGPFCISAFSAQQQDLCSQSLLMAVDFDKEKVGERSVCTRAIREFIFCHPLPNCVILLGKQCVTPPALD